MASLSPTEDPANPSSSNMSISLQMDWIMCGGLKILWIPVRYRSRRLATHGAVVAVGCKSGLVYRVDVDRRFLPT
jgi:hypothetical protein